MTTLQNFNFMTNAFNTLVSRFKKWRLKRKWGSKLQLEYLKMHLQEDQRWMCADKRIYVLCQRYLDMLSDDWKNKPVKDITQFRDELGLNPWKIKKEISHDDNVNRN